MELRVIYVQLLTVRGVLKKLKSLVIEQITLTPPPPNLVLRIGKMLTYFVDTNGTQGYEMDFSSQKKYFCHP